MPPAAIVVLCGFIAVFSGPADCADDCTYSSWQFACHSLLPGQMVPATGPQSHVLDFA